MASNSDDENQMATTAEEDAVTGKDLFPMMGALVTELYHAQYEAAKFFEIAYISVANFPDVAVEVRLSAHQARTYHELSTGLMKKFAVTADQIVDLAIPLIIETVDTVGDKDVVKELFNMVIGWAKDMEHEAENTRGKYLELQGKLQTDIEMIRKKRDYVIVEKANLDLKMKQEHALAAEAKRVEQDLAKERAAAEAELRELKGIRKNLTDQICVGSQDTSYLAVAMMPGVGWGTAAVACATYIFDGQQRGKQLKTLMKGLIKMQASVDKASDRHLKIVFEKHAKSKEVIERMHTMKQLYLRHELLGDESSLLEAVSRIGQADQQLAKMARFWNNMSVLLMYLKNETGVGEHFLEKIGNPAVNVIFKRIMETAKGKWLKFAEVCKTYVNMAERDRDIGIDGLYCFLDGRVDKMSAAEKARHIQHIQDEFAAKYGVPGNAIEDA